MSVSCKVQRLHTEAYTQSGYVVNISLEYLQGLIHLQMDPHALELYSIFLLINLLKYALKII